jgi:hypothetical protein
VDTALNALVMSSIGAVAALRDFLETGDEELPRMSSVAARAAAAGATGTAATDAAAEADAAARVAAVAARFCAAVSGFVSSAAELELDEAAAAGAFEVALTWTTIAHAILPYKY